MGLRVMITDDSVAMRRMIRRVLSMTGLAIDEVVEAQHGADALEQMNASPIDLLLLDVNMPVLNGVECLQQMRQQPSLQDVPTVAVTSEGSTERRNELARLGAAFVKKPFTPEELANAVVDALGGFCGFESSDPGDGDTDF